MMPVVRALRNRGEVFETLVCATAQHRDMMDQVHHVFDFKADVDLDLMRPEQTLNAMCSRAFDAIDNVLVDFNPEWVLVQGDTTTAMVSALAAFHRGIQVGHVEAGLRTGDLQHPFPEESNRRIIDGLAEALFAPTGLAGKVLLDEGIAPEKVHITGNTCIDVLLEAVRLTGELSEQDEVLITVHRRESFGQPIRQIFEAIHELAKKFPEITWVYPVHRNPNVQRVAHEILSDVSNINLLEPLDYLELVRAMQRARLILTDSGGIQEEAPTLHTPVLVLRRTTERPEGVELGVSRLVGTDKETIVEEAARLLTDRQAHRAMTARSNPYGDGRAAHRIAAILADENYQPFTTVS